MADLNSETVRVCTECGGPLSEARQGLGLESCSGPCNAARRRRLAPGPAADTRCTGTDCPGCDAARRHYLNTGCLDSSCPRDHGPASPAAGDAS